MQAGRGLATTFALMTTRRLISLNRDQRVQKPVGFPQPLACHPQLIPQMTHCDKFLAKIHSQGL
jgi:hypothetical protein